MAINVAVIGLLVALLVHEALGSARWWGAGLLWFLGLLAAFWMLPGATIATAVMSRARHLSRGARVACGTCLVVDVVLCAAVALWWWSGR